MTLIFGLLIIAFIVTAMISETFLSWFLSDTLNNFFQAGFFAFLITESP